MAERKPRAGKVAGAETARGRPEVIVEFLFDRGLLSVSVRNIGRRAALSVAVSFDRPFTGLGGAKDVSSARYERIVFQEKTSDANLGSGVIPRRREAEV